MFIIIAIYDALLIIKLPLLFSLKKPSFAAFCFCSLIKRKREAKLTPTEILTLLALVEQAQRHGKIESDGTVFSPSSAAAAATYYQNPNLYQVQNDDDTDDGEWYNNPLPEPSIEYYPLNAYENLYRCEYMMQLNCRSFKHRKK